MVILFKGSQSLKGAILLGHVEKLRGQRRIEVMPMKPRKHSAILP